MPIHIGARNINNWDNVVFERESTWHEKYYRSFSAPMIEDTGVEGPVLSHDQLTKWVDTVRVVENLYHGLVPPGHYDGVHKLEVTRYVRSDTTHSFVLDGYSLPLCEYGQRYCVTYCKDTAWMLPVFMCPESGIYISHANGVMTGGFTINVLELLLDALKLSAAGHTVR